ncbi:hypothetical protein B484DRAFT_282711 [Ochromonadaceae sp. CCMP2298]|nr:hypothetical protein B484DRAFT_282711 [Ochromonadaceae sp. CCMP2298]
MATLSCVCGETSIHLPGKPVLRYECCCCDCRRGLAVCQERGGAKPPLVPDLLYFPNRLQVISGKDHLRCFTLLKGYPTRRVVAVCCWTALLADHPSYESVRLVTYPIPAVITLDDESEVCRPVDTRIFQDDMSAAELAALGPAPNNCSLSGPERKAKADAAARRWMDEQEHEKDVISVQTLIDSVIGKVEVADAGYAAPVPLWTRQAAAAAAATSAAAAAAIAEATV